MLTSNKYSDKFSLLFLLVGFLASQKISIVGHLYIVEIASIFFFIFKNKDLKFFINFKYIVAILFFHLFLVAFSDLMNGSNLKAFLKGFITYPLILLSVLMLYNIFYDKYLSYVSFLVGFILGKNFLNNFFSEYTVYFTSNIWKWGLGITILNIVLLCDEFNKEKKFTLKFTILFMSFISIISLYYSSRALPLTIFYAIILYFLQVNFNFLNLFNKKKNFFLLSFFVFVFTFLIGLLPSKIDSFNHFDELNKKNMSQNSGTFGVVVMARSEWISVYHAFKDKFFYGHGSYPKDENYYYSYKIAEFLYDNYYIDNIPNIELLSTNRVNVVNAEYQLIPAHSFLGYHIVSYGIFGTIIIYLLHFCISKIYISNFKKLNFFYHFNFAFFLYNFYFSPWGAPHRIAIELFVVALLLKQNDIKKIIKI